MATEDVRQLLRSASGEDRFRGYLKAVSIGVEAIPDLLTAASPGEQAVTRSWALQALGRVAAVQAAPREAIEQAIEVSLCDRDVDVVYGALTAATSIRSARLIRIVGAMTADERPIPGSWSSDESTIGAAAVQALAEMGERDEPTE